MASSRDARRGPCRGAPHARSHASKALVGIVFVRLPERTAVVKINALFIDIIICVSYGFMSAAHCLKKDITDDQPPTHRNGISRRATHAAA